MIMSMPSSFAAFLLIALAIPLVGCVNGTDTPSAMFVFGDSYADTGNRNKSDTPWKAPYGYTWPGTPAGRFSDGKILTDYIASHLRISSPAPYNTRWFRFCDFPSGINFAFGGSGIFETYGPEFPTLSFQIDQFQMISNNCSQIKKLINSSVVLLVIVGNDYIAYLQKHPEDLTGLLALIPRVVDGIAASISRLYNIGFRKFAIANLEPAGCIPHFVTSANNYTQCNEFINLLSLYHNGLLSIRIAETSDLAEIKITTLNQYESFRNAQKKFGNNSEPCCKGLNNSSCGDVDGSTKLYTVCSDPTKAFFWDGLHPTQAGWKAVTEMYKDVLDFSGTYGQSLKFEA